MVLLLQTEVMIAYLSVILTEEKGKIIYYYKGR